MKLFPMKRKKLLLGVLPLCALIIGAIFVFNRVASPAHAHANVHANANFMDGSWSCNSSLNGVVEACIQRSGDNVEAGYYINCTYVSIVESDISIGDSNTGPGLPSDGNHAVSCGGGYGPYVVATSGDTYWTDVHVQWSNASGQTYDDYAESPRI